MKTKNLISFFCLVAILMMTLSACAGGATPAAKSSEPIKVGGIFNLTGGQASNDVPALEGVKLAVKEINDKGGVLGRKLDLVSYDAKTDVTTATNIASQLTQVDKVPAIIGFSDTTYVLAAGPVAQKAGVPLITVWASGPIIPKVVGNDMFLVSYGDNVQAAAGAEYAYNKLGLRNAWLMVNKGMDYTKLLGSYFKTRFTEMGGKILAEDSYDLGDTDFSSQITRLKTLNPQPEFLYIAAGPDEVGTVIKQVREAGITVPIIGGDGYDTPSLVELAGPKNADNVYYVTSVGLFAKSPMTEAFVKSYKDEYGKEPQVASAPLGYDAVYLLADAIKRAGSTDPKAIRDALQTTKDLEGVTGKITYPPNDGVPQKTVAIIKVSNGQLEPIAQVVPEKVPAP